MMNKGLNIFTALLDLDIYFSRIVFVFLGCPGQKILTAATAAKRILFYIIVRTLLVLNGDRTVLDAEVYSVLGYQCTFYLFYV